MKLTETKKLLLGHIAQISQKGSFLKAKFARVTVKKREERVGGCIEEGGYFVSKDSRQKIQKRA